MEKRRGDDIGKLKVIKMWRGVCTEVVFGKDVVLSRKQCIQNGEKKSGGSDGIWRRGEQKLKEVR